MDSAPVGVAIGTYIPFGGSPCAGVFDELHKYQLQVPEITYLNHSSGLSGSGFAYV